jgi:hypothetical protein
LLQSLFLILSDYCTYFSSSVAMFRRHLWFLPSFFMSSRIAFAVIRGFEIPVPFILWRCSFSFYFLLLLFFLFNKESPVQS